MNDLVLKTVSFSSFSHWVKPVPNQFLYTYHATSLFDHNGYDLCPLEQRYARVHSLKPYPYRVIHPILSQPWLTQPRKKRGVVLNHSMIVERKGVKEKALEQLESHVTMYPLLNKLIRYKSKWGLDISLDYVTEKECFELFHYEYDSFDKDELLDVKTRMEQWIQKADMDKLAVGLLQRKEEWIHLEFFQQSQWKTNYFNLPPERFKMVGWR
jgi:hypothetical protein